MNYYKVSYRLKPYQPFNEILMVELAEAGFESFQEEEPMLHAYINEEDYDQAKVDQSSLFKNEMVEITFETTFIEKENWNKKWEESFDPVAVDQFCLVKAPFHQTDAKFEYVIEIEPKMSFGTGHHETTQLMIGKMKDIDFNGKRVLDMGSGTGILAILASKMGAKSILAIDNEEWAFENMQENFEKNNISNAEAKLGSVECIKGEFDVVIANINKNILLSQMKRYTEVLANDGDLLLSGFYDFDESDIIDSMNEYGLTKNKSISKENWMVIHANC